MAERLHFQDIIMRLNEYWASHGCLLWQPYNVQVGAGTMNPATFLRVLGPEPWRVAYIEPSVRPADGRYGQNPNRWQQWYQYQVILKPDPGNPQELYLRSLEALGIDARQHDIRFVEDDWESPALGAWGVGWEVWCDGQEITQFTYFQQAGGFSLDPVSVEITYGLERIMLFLQGVGGFVDINWGMGLTYGEVLLRSEVEHCVYNFELADVGRMHQLYSLYEAEAQACLERGLVIPAHDYVLKCSHTFNVLDARGAIGVTERASYFARMRELARRVAEAYLKQREELGYPLLRSDMASSPTPVAPSAEESFKVRPSEPQDFVFEIGTEELPASDLDAALAQLADGVESLLDTPPGIEHGAVRTMGTPRRLVVHIEGLDPQQARLCEPVVGPPAEAAYDSDGYPTRAAEGFARAKGVDVGSLYVKGVGTKRYVVADVPFGGESAVKILARELPRLVDSIRFDRSMRWNDSGVTFSRPIRWLVALYGDQVIPFEYAGVASGRITRGLRPDGSPELELGSAGEYLPTMKAQGILVDRDERRAEIRRQIDRLAAEVGGVVPDDPDLLEEVTNLVERPTAVLEEFSPEYLTLPSPVVTTVMKKHQRYFPVVQVTDEGEELLPYFIAIRNGDTTNQEEVRRGYQEVLRARFADAAFFLEADTRQPLEDFLPRLDTLVFQEQLGSMLDKARRLEKLVAALADGLGLSEEEKAVALRAAHLCKADLATQMVVEFTTLQGVMGREYALRSGQGEAAAEAIFEHYLPRFAGDVLPQTKAGLLLGLADRLDSLQGLFAAGLAPTGSADPFGLRRAAMSLIQVLTRQKIDLDLRQALALAAEQLPIAADELVQAEVLTFVKGRLEGWLREEGYRYDLVTAVLAERGHSPYLASQTVRDFASWVEREDWMDILNSYARCVRIVREFEETFPLKPALFVEPATQELYGAYQRAAARITPESSVDELFEELHSMIPAITCFFDDVLVMTEERALRENRLALLQRISALPRGIVDLTQVMGF